MGRNIRNNHVVRRAVTSLFVGCLLSVPTIAVLGEPTSAGAATPTAASAASSDPLGQLVATVEANLSYYECVIVISVQGLLAPVLGQPGSSGFCIQPPQ
jgi:hypothetical protein